MAERHIQQVCLDNLAAGKLPEQVIASIDKVELTVADMEQWETSKPTIRLLVTEDKLVFEVRVRVSLRKALAILGSLIAILWTSANIAIKYLPTLKAFLCRGLHTP